MLKEKTVRLKPKKEPKNSTRQPAEDKDRSLSNDSQNAITSLATAIAQARTDAGLSQSTLAARVECHPSFLARLERLESDGALPSPETTARIEKELGLSSGTLWLKVEAARKQMKHHRAILREEAAKIELERNNLNPAATPAQKGRGRALEQELLSRSDLDEATSNAIRKIWPDLLAAFADPTRRAMIELFIEGLAKDMRRQTRRG